MYDILLCLSGGKDSISLAFLYKELGIKILAFTSDVGWLSDIARDNIRKTIEILKIDHIFFKHHIKDYDYLIKNFELDKNKKMNDVCTECSALTQQAAMMIATMFGIYRIVGGFTKYNANLGNELLPIKSIGNFEFINPYYYLENYDIKKINQKLNNYGIEPSPIKTNCNKIKWLIQTHMKRFGDDPYKKHLDDLINDNQITKEEYEEYFKFTGQSSESY